MKIDIESLRPCNADILPRCMQLIEHIKSAPDEESFFSRLVEVHEWQPQFGKSEMARWADVLNMCDEVLKRAVTHVDTRGVLMAVDAQPITVRRVAAVLSFTALLFENTFTRSIYNSADRLMDLLDSGNMEVVVETLRLLQVISKRSRFLSQHLSESQQKQLTMKLTAIVQCWSGKLRNSKMDECCISDVWAPSLLPICYQAENSTKLVRSVQLDKSLALEMDELLSGERIDEEERISLFARMRLVRAFCSVEGRRLCVVARLLALSILVYSRTLLEEWQLSSMIYDSLVEEISQLLLVDIEPSGVLVDTIKTEALRTLTSIISLDRPAKQNVVVECLGANSYHGFMARAVRICVEDLRRGTLGAPGHTSVQFCTALFSLLYHLAGFDNGGEALVSCALTESLLSVVGCESVPLEQISFATRAVRVLDIMTSLDANAFTANNGMNVIINRLAVEVKECKAEIESHKELLVEPCHQQRAALIKSLLNFIKRAVQDSQFADSVRHIMDGALPAALIQIISRCDFFGASLFHNAIGLVTNFIYQEPSLLTTIQDKGVTIAIMDAIFRKELPASRDVLSALPNTFTALCLNERGLQAFIAEEPFEHVCNILLSTKFISAMKRRRNEMNEASVSLGSALDDLLRHQPTLRPLLLNSIVKMLDKLVEFASCEQPRCVMSLSSSRSLQSVTVNASNVTVSAGSPSQNDEQNVTSNNDTSDEDDDDPPSAAPNMEQMSPMSERSYAARDLGLSPETVVNGEKVLPLGEYLLNVSKLLETLLTQSASSEQAEAFVRCGAANRLITLLFVRQIPLEVSQSIFPQLVSNILRYLYQQTRNDEIVESITQQLLSYCEQLIELCTTPTSNMEQTASASANCASLLIGVPVNQALPLLCAVMVFSSLLTNLSKMAFGVNPNLRNNVLKYWTNGKTGCKLMVACHHLQRLLAWESAVLQAFNAVIKVSSATQTDGVDEVDMSASHVPLEATTEHPCDSVGAESVPHKSNSCPIYLQRLAAAEDCWLRTKSGVTALTRCQRQLDELMAMLAKVCTSGIPRRRTHEPFTAAPDKNTVALANHLLSAYKVAFGWQPKQDVVPAVYLPYLTGWITRLTGIMFDERRMPYHVLLSAFYHSGCHSTYFSIIRRCVSMEMHQKQSVEVEQLLQTWLSLTERLVNADAFLHSRHRLPQHCVETKRFPPQKYLTLCQQDALREVSTIFGLLVVSMKAGNASVSVCELTVSVYKEVLKGLIPSTDTTTKNAVSAEERNRLIAELDEASINFLVDMGFDRDTVIEALFEYATVEEATDFLVANDRQQHASPNDILIDELEDGEGAEMNEERKDADGEEVEKGTEEETSPPLNEVTPLDVSAVLESACSEVVPACMQMIELGVELVFNTSELILAIVNDVSAEWRCNVLVKQYLVHDVAAMLQKLTTDPSNEAVVHTLSTRLHLCCLLWAAIANDYLVECAHCSLQCMLLSTLELTASTQQSTSHALVKLVAPVCLWLDLYEKMLTVKCNRAKLEKVVESLSWKYWDADERGGTFMWVNYRPASSHILTRAFMEGRAGAKLSIAGKHYAVSFVTMSQRNVDSHVERPITVVARLKEDANIELFFKADDAVVEWNEVVRARMVPAVIALMGTSGLDSNAVHALLILAARITRNAEVATEMLRHGGVQAVVNVAGCPFATRALLVALVVRHCLDDETSLCQIFEKTIRTVAAGGYTLNPPSTRWHHRMPRTTREWLHAMRALAPLCARHPRLFVSTMERVARKQNGQITTVPMPPSEGGPKLPPPSAPVRQVVQQLMDHVMDFSWEDSSRVVTRATLIRLIAELVKSYSAVAMLVAESQHAGTHSALLTLLDKCIVTMPDTESSDSTASAIELLMAVKSLVIALASCNHSPKAQEALVADIGTAFRIALTETDSKVAAMKIKTLCDLILLARDMCPAGGHEARATGSLHANLNPILRLLIKKRICIELAKVPWHLNLSTKEGIDALNHVLKTLDELTRSINSTASGTQSEGVTGTRASSQNASATLTLTTTTNAADAVNPTPARTSNALNDGAVGESADAEQQHEHHPIVRRMLEEFNEQNEEPQPETEEDSTETDEEEEENADEEMEFEDDEVAANEIDIEDESDEEEEERDDEAMREEGQDSDEENDFGLIDMGDESIGRRFEDGDPDNTLIDANVFLESLDDIDRLGGYEVSRADRSSVSEVALHPLMQRPALNADTATLRNTGYRLTISGRRPATVTAPGLHRQGAVRRWGTVGPQRDILERLIESGTVANAAHLFDVLPSRQRLFNIILHESASEAINTALGEERRHAAVPSPLERFTEAAHLIDAHSHFYVWLVVAHHITACLDDLEKKEKEDKEKLESKKKELEKENINETKEAEGNITGEVHVGSAAEAQPSEQPDSVDEAGLDSVEPAPSENAFVVENSENGDERMFQTLPPSVSAEPMDTTDSGTVFFDAHENLEGDSSERQEEMMTAATVRSPTPEESNEMLVSTPPLSPHREAECGTEEASVSNAAEEYRDILGDIQVPEGVDPAFLAALPEDIRAEVIRDHERQQRAQRLAQSAASAAAEGAPDDEAAAADGGSAPRVEPLDQEFLNALPPELQEEILAQHERTVRLANERAENAASSSGAGGEPPPSTEGDDAAALIESLPPSLRAQVLADADDTVLQVLPQSVAAEARRLRANLEQQQVMRFARMLAPGRFQRMIGSRGSTLTPSSAQLGALAGATTLASKNATQLLDRDALVTLVMLFFVDPARFSAQRLQKVLRSVCVQSATCDFVVWCLVAVLDKVTSDSSRYEEFAGSSTGWIDHICVPSALGQRERAIKFFKNYHSVVVHPAVAASATRLVLEMLTSLARAYPGHFVPAKLRSADSTASANTHSHPLSQFWHIVHGLSKGETQQLRSSGHRHSTSSISMECSSAQGGVSASLASATLEESAVGLLMAYLNRAVVSSSSQLQDKLLRLVCTIVQTLPDDTMAKLSIDEKLERPPLAEQLGIIVTVLTEGKCSEEGLADGRTLLMEAIRALAPSTRMFLHSLFISAAERLGQRLLPLMAQLQNELRQVPVRTEDSTLTLAPLTSEQSSSRRTTINRYDESTVVIDGVSNSRQVMNSSGCEELQLPAVRALTDKHGVQNTLLRTLHTIIKMKDALDANAIRKPETQKNERDGAASSKVEEERLSVLLSSLEPLWGLVSACLQRLAKADAHAALALQPAAEAFFLVHGSALSGVDPNKPIEHPDAIKLVQFAEKHRTVLNQVLRQSGSGLSDGPFSILIQMPKLLDFDVKRKYFRKQMQRLDGPVRGEDVAVRIRRSHLFSDSFRELFRLRGPEWKARFYIIFEGEEGQDAGGLLREWFSVITREIFNPNYALFITAPGDRVTYMINKASYINPEHLEYFKFVGRIIAKAIYENKLLDCYFTRAFYKHILSVPVRAQDLESEDPSFYKSLEFLLNNPIEELGTELTFSVEVEEFGVRKMRELKEGGASIPVTDDNKEEYVKLVCQMKMTGSINQQLSAFLDGFYEVIPKQLISMFNEQELELLISGLPNIDIDDLYANTEYKTYSKSSAQIQWFWKALRSFEQEDRAKFLQFVTGTSKVPLQGFASLEGMNGVQKFSIHMDSRSCDRLPAAHTCFNQLDLPQYESYEKLRDMLLLAVRECTEGFGFA